MISETTDIKITFHDTYAVYYFSWYICRLSLFMVQTKIQCKIIPHQLFYAPVFSLEDEWLKQQVENYQHI